MTDSPPAQAPPPERSARDLETLIPWLRERIGECAAQSTGLAVLFVDYDVVARLDGARGFEAGSAAHRCLLDRMRGEVLRPQDALGEVARGQMACGLFPMHSSGVARLAASKAMRVLGEAIPVGDTQVHARPAIGIALYPEHGETPDLLLKHARIACRAARDLHERIAEFDAAQEDPRATGLFLENRLRHALLEELLRLAFQPRIELFTERLVGVECLLHWPDRERPPATPSELLGAVESTEIANRVAAWLLHAAVRNGADFLHRGLNLRIGLKLPAVCLRAPEFPDLVDRALHTWPVQRGQLVVTFAGLAALGTKPEVIDSLQRLRKLGVKLSLDSLGSGDATLFDLATVPFDELRIPLRLLPGLASVPRQEKILRALAELGHQLGLVVVADGADDPAVAARLAELGCDHAQGGHFGLPLDAAQFIAAYEGSN